MTLLSIDDYSLHLAVSRNTVKARREHETKKENEEERIFMTMSKKLIHVSFRYSPGNVRGKFIVSRHETVHDLHVDIRQTDENIETIDVVRTIDPADTEKGLTDDERHIMRATNALNHPVTGNWATHKEQS